MAEGTAFTSVLRRRLTHAGDMARYRDDPRAWARDRLGVHLWSKQQEIVCSVRDVKRTSVQSAHGVGKSFTAAVLAAWWIDVHPPGTALVVSTAPSYNQVHTILWEEIRKFHRSAGMAGHVRLDDHWIDDLGQTVGFGQRPADHNRSSFQGHHRKYVLVLIDEACGVPEWLWTAAETITTGDDCRILAIGNPDDNSAHFAKVCLSDPKWHTIKISAFDSPALTDEWVPAPMYDVLVTENWVRDAIDAWGEASPVTQSKVYGKFSDSEAGVIPQSWVREANMRWLEWDALGRPEPAGRRIFSLDVARFGTDRTALATRQGHVFPENVLVRQGLDAVQAAALVSPLLHQHPQSMAVVDSEGIGGPVVDILRHEGHSPRAFAAGEPTAMRDITGKLGFPNTRSAMWWNGREHLNPYRNPLLALPPDPPDQPRLSLTADLCAPMWEVVPGALIKVEKKEDLIKRTGQSPDLADAVLMALWVEHLDDGRDTTANAGGGLRPRSYRDPDEPRQGEGQRLRPRHT